MSVDVIEQMSEALADRVAAATCVVAVRAGHRHLSGILWRPDQVVTSEQLLGERTEFTVARGGTVAAAKLTGRDPGTNVALLRLDAPLLDVLPEAAAVPRVGSLALVLGTDAAGAPTGRLAMLHAVGAEWHSQAGGRIDALLRLDVRLGADEGGPVLTPRGKLLGMSTSGPRRRALVIPAATIERVLPALLADGHVARGWLGVGLQPVAVPESLRAAAGCDSGMMVINWRTARRLRWRVCCRVTSCWMSMARRRGARAPWRRRWGRNGSVSRWRCACCGPGSCARMSVVITARPSR